MARTPLYRCGWTDVKYLQIRSLAFQRVAWFQAPEAGQFDIVAGKFQPQRICGGDWTWQAARRDVVPRCCKSHNLKGGVERRLLNGHTYRRCSEEEARTWRDLGCLGRMSRIRINALSITTLACTTTVARISKYDIGSWARHDIGIKQTVT